LDWGGADATENTVISLKPQCPESEFRKRQPGTCQFVIRMLHKGRRYLPVMEERGNILKVQRSIPRRVDQMPNFFSIGAIKKQMSGGFFSRKTKRASRRAFPPFFWRTSAVRTLL
jgi:hypothetical protein